MKMQLGNRYLVKDYLSGITELKCIEITESSYKIQYENSNTTWVTKKEVEYWRLLEDLGISKFLNEAKRDDEGGE